MKTKRNGCRPTAKILSVIAMVMWCSMAFAQSQGSSEYVLREYLKQYPKAELKDVYKFCFQDYFGPGHLMSSPEQSRAYLETELAGCKTFGGPVYEPTGLEGNYYRVNLSVVAEGKVPFETLFNALCKSTFEVDDDDIEQWKQVWNHIENQLRNLMQWNIVTEAQAKEIQDMLAGGDYAGHHSQIYNETYNFHYRIIRKDIFLNEIKPLL